MMYVVSLSCIILLQHKEFVQIVGNKSSFLRDFIIIIATLSIIIIPWKAVVSFTLLIVIKHTSCYGY